MRSLFGLASGGVCRAGLLPGSRCARTAPFHPCHAPRRTVRRFAFCCTFRRLAPPRRYLAPCPVEPGLSSAPFRMTRLRSEEHTSELQSLMRISYAVFCLEKKSRVHVDTKITQLTNKSTIRIETKHH